MNYALFRTPADGGPRTALAASTGHRQAAKSYSSGSSRLSQPSRSLTGRCRAAWYCASRARQLSRSCLYRSARSRCRSAAPVDVATSSRLAAPRRQPPRPRSASPCSASTRSAADVAEGAQPGRPGHLGAARLGAVEHLVDEPGRAAEHQERRVYRVDPARSPTTPPDAVGIRGRGSGARTGRPGPPTAAHQVDQRVRLVAQQLEHAGPPSGGSAPRARPGSGSRTRARMTRRPSPPGRAPAAPGGRRSPGRPTA